MEECSGYSGNGLYDLGDYTTIRYGDAIRLMYGNIFDFS
jgi:hypothetical protein